jgi:hypothetical protein
MRSRVLDAPSIEDRQAFAPVVPGSSQSPADLLGVARSPTTLRLTHGWDVCSCRWSQPVSPPLS